MAVSRASGIVQMPTRASKMQSILFSTQNTYVTSPAGRPCAGLIGFRAKKGICKTTGVGIVFWARPLSGPSPLTVAEQY